MPTENDPFALAGTTQMKWPATSSKYGVIYGDPPYLWKAYSAKGEGRSAVCHYPCMSLKELTAFPVPDLAAKDSVLLLWAIDPLLQAALDLIKAWGFEFKTVGFYWAKINRNADPGQLSESDFFTGLGYWTRADVEQCMPATRGHPPAWRRMFANFLSLRAGSISGSMMRFTGVSNAVPIWN